MTQRADAENGDSRIGMILASLGLVGIIGVFDYLTGFELYFFAFYLIPVTLGGWFVGRGFGVFVSVLCVAASVASDFMAGARVSAFVLIWNTFILFTFYTVVILILMRLRSLYDELEERVRQRTAALQNEMAERARLEEEIMRVSEREQRRIGHDLHDSLCQQLTATALAGKVLSGQLNGLQAKAADHIVELIEDSIELTRQLARGLHPEELTGESFTDALRELAAIIRERFKVQCQFEYEGDASCLKHDEAMHLYRIAQEAISNALRHSHSSEIIVRWKRDEVSMMLSVSDDGVGLPEGWRSRSGMGMRIMAYRASLIGAAFNAETISPRGTRVACLKPNGETGERAGLV